MISAKFPDLGGKKILVTGGTRGIGEAIAKALAVQGAHVAFSFRKQSEVKAHEVALKLKELGALCVTPLCFDVMEIEVMREALHLFVKEYGPLEGLVNNAGISRDQLLLRLKEDELSQTLETNLKGPIMLIQALSRSFLRSKGASIVNISSVVGLMGNAGQIAYSASKAGLLGLTKSVAKELGGRNIRCNALCPGLIETEMTDLLNEETKKAYLGEIPLMRFGKTTDVANLACFLLSEASSYITGEIVKIDGGLYT